MSARSLEEAAEAAFELLEAGDRQAGLAELADVFDRAVVASGRDADWLLELAGRYERVLGRSADEVAEAATVFARAEQTLAPMSDRDRGRALWLRTRFVTDVADTDDLGAAALVGVLGFADETLQDFGDLNDPEQRSLRAALRHERIRLGIRARAYPTRRDVYAAFDAAAALIAGANDAELIGRRVALLMEAADFAAEQDDCQIAANLLAEAEAEAGRAPGADAAALLWPVRVRRISITLARSPVEVALRDALALAAEPSPDPIERVFSHGLIARAVGARLRAEGRDDEARALEDRLLLRFVGTADPEVRAAAIRELRWGADTEDDPESYSAAERDALQRTISAFETDTDPIVQAEVDTTLLRWASAESHLGAHRTALNGLDRLMPRLRERIAAGDQRAGWLQARALLVAHFAYAGVGDRTAALDSLGQVAARTAAHDAEPGVRAVRAQAAYWRSRLLREQGDASGSRAVARALIEEFGHDPEDAARRWASASLFSQWKAPEVEPHVREAALARHGELFAEDADPQIRARDIRRRIGQAMDLRDTGRVSEALDLLDRNAEDFTHGPARHPKIASAVLAARDLRAVFTVLPGGSAAASEPPPLGPSMAEVDALNTEGNRLLDTDPAAARAAYARAAEIAATATDPYARLAGIVAFDNLTAALLASGDLAGLLTAAERMVRTCDEVATLELPSLVQRRVTGERMTGLYRWAVGLSRIGDTARALHLYSLVADAAPPGQVTDEDQITAISQSLYNRAVLLDDRGDVLEAVAGYAALADAHRYWPDSLPRRIRLVKAHRNRGALLERLGRPSEAADDYRSAVDLARGSEHPELRSRMADSLARYAESAIRSGSAAAAVERLDWALGGGVPLDTAEAKRLRTARTAAAKAARRR